MASGRRARRRVGMALFVATSAAAAHVVASLYWALGGTFLLETVGESGRAVGALGPLGASLALVLVAVSKGVVAAAGWHAARAAAPYPVVRAMAWVAGILLAGYGSVLSIAGWLALAGCFGPVRDLASLQGHALWWDPLFAIWGAALTVALWRSRPATAGSPRSVPAPRRLPSLGR